MINHGISTGGLFAVFGMIYERYHTREIRELGGLARHSPVLSLFMLLFTFSSIGLPGMNGFAGEFLILLGMFQRGYAQAPPSINTNGRRSPCWRCSASCSGRGTCFGFTNAFLSDRSRSRPTTKHTITGPPAPMLTPMRMPPTTAMMPMVTTTTATASPRCRRHSRDMNAREFWALAPLVVLVFWIGVFPQTFLAPFRPTSTPCRRPSNRPTPRISGPRTTPPSLPAPAPLPQSPNRDRPRRTP